MDKKKNRPLVSIIIPMFNETGLIETNLESLFKQTYPQDKIEICVVDGMSDDGSREKVLELSREHSNVFLLDNPERRTPVSLNIGIRNSKGSVIIILGAHTRVKEDFVEQNIGAMERTGAKCVGGTQINIGDSLMQKAIGLAMGSPFGIPSAPYRYWKKERNVDTVVYAAYRRELFDEIGFFHEEGLISEDAELNWRIRKAGHEIHYTPKIVTYYYPRKDLKGLIRHLFRYGVARVNMMKKHADAVKFFHLVPPVFVAGSVLFALLGLWIPIFFIPLAFVWGLYLFCVLFFSFLVSMKSDWKNMFVLPVIFVSIHISWGLGFLIGFFKRSP